MTVDDQRDVSVRLGCRLEPVATLAVDGSDEDVLAVDDGPDDRAPASAIQPRCLDDDFKGIIDARNRVRVEAHLSTWTPAPTYRPCRESPRCFRTVHPGRGSSSGGHASSRRRAPDRRRAQPRG